MAQFFISNLSKEEFEELYESSKTAFDVKCVIYKIGPGCNALRRISFAKAQLDLQPVLGGKRAKPVVSEFSKLFKRGFDMMENVFSGVKYEDFDEQTKKSLQILCTFQKNMDTHEASLRKVLKQSEDLKETDVVIAISEHLLSKLCPGNEYFINLYSEGEHVCRCGCNARVQTKGTGIGNENVWHGYLDVVFESHGEIIFGGAVSAEIENLRRLNLEDKDNEGADDLTEVKQKSIPDIEAKKDVTEAIENQAAAEAVVFSISQKNAHPEYENFLIPFISMSASYIRIYMYDGQNDILIRCEELPIFMDTGSSSLSPSLVITLWVILHYKYFCSGVDFEDLRISLKDAKAGFEKYTTACPKYYGPLLRSFIDKFPVVVQETYVIDKVNDWMNLHKSYLIFPPYVDPD